jgi:hypothetical protein
MANTQLARQPLPWAYYYFFWLIEPVSQQQDRLPLFFTTRVTDGTELI